MMLSSSTPSQPPASVVPGAAAAEAGRQAALDALAKAEERLKLCERRLVELNHRVANTLQIASGLIQAQRDRLADLSAKEALTAASARVVRWRVDWCMEPTSLRMSRRFPGAEYC